MNEIGQDIAVDVSVIVPVYNAQRYLEECFASIDRQDFTGIIEIIIVDDASDDASCKICSNFSRSSKKNTLLIRHETNSGVSVARNSGLDAASGEYFVFVDADDILPVDAIRILYDAAYAHDADIVKGDIKVVSDDVSIRKRGSIRRPQVFQGENIFRVLLEHRLVRGHSWGKLFRKELKSERFPSGVAMAEDLLFCAGIFSRANRLVVIPDCVYIYRKHSASATGAKYKTGLYIDWFDSVDKLSAIKLSDFYVSEYRGLKVLTLLQALGEIKKLDEMTQKEVLTEIAKRKRTWGLSASGLLGCLFVGPRYFFKRMMLELIIFKFREADNFRER
ncbi:MAG: glycosyltransferase family 2 protein [Pseudomonadales bacterium]|nr:glycosyltransferase family 2 protein [Pseudomonadales bacterium]